jgi:hypothetical protein
MKKHKNILVILILAIVFVGILIWNDQQVGMINIKGPKPQGTENLQDRLDSLGKNTYDPTAYKALKSDIGASEMAQVITTDEMTILLASLEDKVTSAMVLSFDQWLLNECGDFSPKINNLISLMKKQDASVASPDVKKRVEIFSNFKSFLAIQGSVNSFTKGEYTEVKANALASRISNALNQEGVSSCSSMAGKRNDWMNEITNFKKIHDAFGVFTSMSGSASEETCEKYKPYTFYYNQLLTSRKCY